MSKSLKNFITIREVLKHNTTRQIRLLFLLQSWHSQMDYFDGSIAEARAKERQLLEFFLTINALFRKIGNPNVLAATPQSTD